jgi:small subunit ribosomal protein S2e
MNEVSQLANTTRRGGFCCDLGRPHDYNSRRYNGGIRRRGCSERRCSRRKNGTKEWIPCTKLGRLVHQGKIKSIEQIYLHSIPIKEYQIVEHILGPSLKPYEFKTKTVQKQTTSGQRMSYKAYVIVGDRAGHVGLGVKSAKTERDAKFGANNLAKINVIPVRLGYWGNKIGKPHSISLKVTGKCGSVLVRLLPAPRGTGIVAARIPEKVLRFAGIEDVYTCSRGFTASLGNFIRATYDALSSTYGFLTPDMWLQTNFQTKCELTDIKKTKYRLST